jgi:hypothetical protein
MFFYIVLISLLTSVTAFAGGDYHQPTSMGCGETIVTGVLLLVVALLAVAFVSDVVMMRISSEYRARAERIRREMGS